MSCYRLILLLDATCSCIGVHRIHRNSLLLQALSIPTKINKGTVEIVSDVKLITAGDKVGASEATLLSKLGIKPFEYGLVIQKVSSRSLTHNTKGYWDLTVMRQVVCLERTNPWP